MGDLPRSSNELNGEIVKHSESVKVALLEGVYRPVPALKEVFAYKPK